MIRSELTLNRMVNRTEPNIGLFGKEVLGACCGCGGGLTDTCGRGHDFDVSLRTVFTRKMLRVLNIMGVNTCRDIRGRVRLGTDSVAEICAKLDKKLARAPPPFPSRTAFV